ncbi:unnamed protein product [Phytophthora fragariaefolia]|uniref:Unnamed protein product n=1 Tax=Phytophthora fragariaefolia TaxID=1490495 RepID=A0A9W6YFM6_9STRA|nr:unnamed protein product [Phytophthora fragariaefolia]
MTRSNCAAHIQTAQTFAAQQVSAIATVERFAISLAATNLHSVEESALSMVVGRAARKTAAQNSPKRAACASLTVAAANATSADARRTPTKIGCAARMGEASAATTSDAPSGHNALDTAVPTRK